MPGGILLPEKGGKEIEMEKVKINEKLYELVVNGVQLTDQGGRVIFQPAAATFAEVEADIKATKAITILDDAGEPILTRSDLVYTGRLAKDDNYVVGIELVQTDAALESEEAVILPQEVIGTAMIAEFRAPDLRDKVTKLEAQVAYMAMMSNIEMEV